MNEKAQGFAFLAKLEQRAVCGAPFAVSSFILI
jgi:hypothetical protein